jgi:hypothetical protein
MLWANGSVADDVKEGHVWFHEHPFNVGQHVAHNEMLDEAVRLGYSWHTRVDDDCFLISKNVFKRLQKLASYATEPAVMGIQVDGLNNPPQAETVMTAARERIEKVDVLGGIFRMSPMSVVRYWRWEERLPMGFGEALQFAKFCSEAHVPLYRIASIRCSHGGSTNAQQEKDDAWSYEHDMLQFLPLGL